MTLTALNWTLAIVGSIGFAGMVALVIFAPGAAAIAEKGVVIVIRDMLRTRIGTAILVAVLCLIVGELAGDWHGRTACRADQARAEQEAAARDKTQGDLAATDAGQKSDALKSAAAQDREVQNALSHADATCHGITRDQLR
jgi:hypothetical protein